MKIVKIFQENSLPIELEDDDPKDLESYIRELSNVIELDNMTIVHLSTGSLILRPGKILSILVSEKIEDNKKEESKIETPKLKFDEVITDID